MTKLYCATCRKHTDHTFMHDAYATICTVCHSHTSLFMRVQAANAALSQSLNAPDGSQAQIVEDTPDTVTFYIPEGQYRGYYDYNKNTGAKQIRQID